MVTEYKHNPNIPYSLHDMVVDKITHEGDLVCLQFEHGYTSLKKPYPQVDGEITIEKVDSDFACVFLLSDNGKYGNFKGSKLSLDEFLERHKEYSFEIVDELYGYNTVQYGGYLSLPLRNDLIEITISLYYSGNIVYTTAEA